MTAKVHASLVTCCCDILQAERESSGQKTSSYALLNVELIVYVQLSAQSLLVTLCRMFCKKL